MEAVAEQSGSSCRLKKPTAYEWRLPTPGKESLRRTLPKYLSLTIQRKRPARALDLPLSRKQSMITAAQSASVQNKEAALRLLLFCRQNKKEEEKRLRAEGGRMKRHGAFELLLHPS